MYDKTWGSLSFSTWTSAFSHIYQWSFPTINLQCKPVLFAEDNNIILHLEINKWTKANKLAFNFDRITFFKFCIKNKTRINWNRGYDDKTIEMDTTKFLGLQIYSNLNWKTHIQYTIPKLSSAYFAASTVHHSWKQKL